MEPSQEVKYLGMYICLTTMEYKAPTDKEDEVIKLAQEVLAEQKKRAPTDTRKLAKVIGKLVALKVSHGPVTNVATRQVQCKMGAEVIQNGWDGNVQLGQQEAAELSWICDNLKAFNGRGIRTENAGPVVCR